MSAGAIPAEAGDGVDWYTDELPGPAFAAGLHALRARGPVVPVRALDGALPVFYVVGYRALQEAFRDGDRFPPGHAYQIISQPYIGETFMRHLARKNLSIAARVLAERLPGLRLLDAEAAAPRGILLRGPRALPVAW